MATTANSTAEQEHERALTHRAVRDEILNYSQQHPNDFGTPDGRQRIPMKKLMKLFAIKKKSPMERQNRFRTIINDICDLEALPSPIGKVLVLRVNAGSVCSSSSSDDNDCDSPNGGAHSDISSDNNDNEGYNTATLGYGDCAPTPHDHNYNYNDNDNYNYTDYEVATKADAGTAVESERTPRFRPPNHCHSGGDLSIATVDSVGVYDYDYATSASTAPDNHQISSQQQQQQQQQLTRRIGYRRRGSVTRYSITAHNTVQEEYKRHDEIIRQFRRDSMKIENSMRNVSIKEVGDNDEDNDEDSNGNSNGNSNSNSNNKDTNNAESSAESSSSRPSQPGTTAPANHRPAAEQGRRLRQQHNHKKAAAAERAKGEGGNAVQKSLRHGRFSLAF